jgi:hypothetical protein
MEHRGYERECGELVVVGRPTDVCDPGTFAVCG